MISITYNEKTIEVNPNLFLLPSEVLCEFGEKTHNQATISELAKNYFLQKDRSESFAHPSITFFAISLAVVTAVAGIVFSGFLFISIPPLGILSFYSTLFVTAMLGAWAVGNNDALDSRKALPQSEKTLKEHLADNIAFAMKDHTELKRLINDRIKKIESIMSEIKTSEISLNNHELASKKNNYEWALKSLDSCVENIKKQIL